MAAGVGRCCCHLPPSSLALKRSSSSGADTLVCTDEEQYSRSIRCCETLSSPPSICFLSRVQSGPHIQQAVGMFGLIPGNSFGGKVGQMGFSFQADGREQGVFVPALLWKVNKQNL